MTITAILKMFDKEIKKMKVSQMQSELRILMPDYPALAVVAPDEKVPDKIDEGFHYLIFAYRGEARKCECGQHEMPIFEFDHIT